MLRKEHRWKVFDNRVLMRILGPKRDGIIGSWRKRHNEELHNMCSPPNVIRMIKSRRIRWSRHVAYMGAKRNGYRVLVVKPEGKRPPRRARRRWENNIEMYFRETGWGIMDWIDLAQEREQRRDLVNRALNLLVP
jgi:hypothetical protein